MPYGNSLHCPSCYQLDRVEKVSSIVSGGIHKGKHSGYSAGVILGTRGSFISRVELDSHMQTEKAKSLSPPDPPRRPWGNWQVTIAISLGLSFSFVSIIPYRIFSANFMQLLVAIILGILAVMLITYLVMRKSVQLAQQKYQQARQSYYYAMGRWNQLFYCHRCDGVFMPGSKRFVSSYAMIGYIYT